MNFIIGLGLLLSQGLRGSGRSDITDFEEVVRLDKEYIENWNMGLDVKILLQTMIVVIKRDGSV